MSAPHPSHYCGMCRRCDNFVVSVWLEMVVWSNIVGKAWTSVRAQHQEWQQTCEVMTRSRGAPRPNMHVGGGGGWCMYIAGTWLLLLLCPILSLPQWLSESRVSAINQSAKQQQGGRWELTGPGILVVPTLPGSKLPLSQHGPPNEPPDPWVTQRPAVSAPRRPPKCKVCHSQQILSKWTSKLGWAIHKG